MDLLPCNFRPILPNVTFNNYPILYRSSTLDCETDESLRWLRETLAIKSYIDLRQEMEFCPTSNLDNFFEFRTFNEITPIRLKKDSILKNSAYRYHVGLMRLDFYNKKEKLSDFYIKLLDQYRDRFRRIFMIMTFFKCFPIIISCSGGKDRTGVMSALIMQLMGFSDEDIIRDFSKSEQCFESTKAKVKETKNIAYVNEEFLHSHPNEMKTFLQHLKDNWMTIFSGEKVFILG